jgi:lipopolysaccharide biosynthesis regulator YciM
MAQQGTPGSNILKKILRNLDLEELQDLLDRLIDEYNNSKPFFARPEDRLVIRRVIDKLTPTNPITIGVIIKCPNCDFEIDKYHSYCPYCGQALDNFTEGQE